ncbi:SAM-dependent methyltransferase [Streptomyces sp. NPDC047123]|uniref:SAM-dependent methyltransferase n=1 Tax=Streptomyces sp. NPDC047123 TaxID=3155622 RepID=UPI0033DC8D89
MADSTYIDTSTPHPARMYDWFLGGKDNYPVDEEMGRRLVAMDGRVLTTARANRAFLQRATRWLASQGVRQFLDIGTGIPTEPNLHQIAQRIAPESRVVYCDNDPIVLAHAEALLRSSPRGATAYIQADFREPEKIVEEAAQVLDLERPVALCLVALLHFIADEDGAYELVDRLMAALPSGSHLLLSHGTADFSPRTAQQAAELYAARGMTLALRSHAEVERFFARYELVMPGVAVLDRWKPELGEWTPQSDEGPTPGYGAVARKL